MSEFKYQPMFEHGADTTEYAQRDPSSPQSAPGIRRRSRSEKR